MLYEVITIRYKEGLISSRLEELAPITAMKSDLENIANLASRADREQDFDLLRITSYNVCYTKLLR